jgi:enoyl-CoA hydratase
MSGVGLTRHGGVIVATMDRTQKRNAADLEVYHRLEEALGEPAEAVVLTGAGGDFSAGDDVTMFDFTDEASARDFLLDVTRLFQLVESVPRPVVAAVDGYALGFGFELALVSDAIVATPRARFGLPEITHGAAPPNAMGRGLDVMGRGWIRHLALSGRHWITGVEAHERALVAELHEPGVLLAEAVRLAAEMAVQPHFWDGKRVVNRDAEATYRLVPQLMAPLMASAAVADAKERYARR